MAAKRNESGKIALYLSNNFRNHKKVDEFENLGALKKEGERLLKSGALCAGDLPAREYAYQTLTGGMKYRLA